MKSDSAAFRCGYVAVVGQPNAGKSSLINAILGQKLAIVSAKPQTTRKLQICIHTTELAQYVFCDTPGLARPRDELGRKMFRASDESLGEADVVLWVVDVSARVTGKDANIGRRLRENAADKPVVLAMNKSDRLRRGDVIERTNAIRGLAPGAQWMLVSARRGDNLGLMLDQISAVLPAREQYFSHEEITHTSMNELAGELVREAALHYLQKEVPHGVGVLVEEFQENSGEMSSIAVTIVVEKERHKAIVIGRKGRMLKLIGARARREISVMLGGGVYLETYVKVEEGWRNDVRQVSRMV